ncbi:hypothetical protein CDL15_Pgr025933 [Punica granatum]|uniref:Uncharacterized protein n=1 Tax=Punica granatum TaxID=22663 RepID=A0A218WC17_PUNGR|nr:hypothetical protein CDL15_Pgr025933 [Punica granatum]
MIMPRKHLQGYFHEHITSVLYLKDEVLVATAGAVDRNEGYMVYLARVRIQMEDFLLLHAWTTGILSCINLRKSIQVSVSHIVEES